MIEFVSTTGESMLKFGLHQKRFRVVANDTGISDEHTTFQCCVDENTITESYSGGPIVVGQIVGTVIDDETFGYAISVSDRKQ